MDWSFLKLYDSINEAISDDLFKRNDTIYFLPIQLSPTEAYSQLTNRNGGISLDGLYTCTIVNSCDEELFDVTSNVFIEQFIDFRGDPQLKIEIVNINKDFYGQAVHLKLAVDSSNQVYYTRPIKISNKNIDKTYRIDYWNSLNLYNADYVNSGFKQSIRLELQFKGYNNESEVGSYYQISNSNTISTRPLRKISRNYLIESCDTFLYERLQFAMFHDYIYIDGHRATNKPIVEAEERLGRSNLLKASFNAFINREDAYTYEYQIFAGLVIESIVPINSITSCIVGNDATITYSVPITLNTGIVTIYDASDNSVVRTFTQADMSVFGNELTITNFLNPILPNGEYYVHVSFGLVSALGIDSAQILDNSTWAFNIVDGDYALADYSTDYLQTC